MKFAHIVALFLTSLLVTSATGTVLAVAKLKEAEHNGTAALNRANQIVHDAERVGGLALEEVSLLQGYLRGATTRSVVEEARIDFSKRIDLADQVAGGHDGGLALKQYLAKMSQVEADIFSVATPAGEQVVWDVVETQERTLAAVLDELTRAAREAEEVGGADAARLHFAEARASFLEYGPTLRENKDATLLAERFFSSLVAAERELAAADPRSSEGADQVALASTLASIRSDAEAYFGSASSLERHADELLVSHAATIERLASEATAIAQEEAVIHLAEASVAQRQARLSMAGAVLLTGLPAILFSIFLGRRFQRRLGDFDTASTALAAGRFDVPPAKNGDELDRLADTWSGMLTALRQRELESKEQAAVVLQNERMATLGSLLAGVAHEVNNPLAFIKSNEEMGAQDIEMVLNDANSKLSDDAKATLTTVRESLRMNVDGIARVEKLNHALKGFGGPARAVREPVDLNDVLEGVLIIAHNRLKNKYRIIRQLEPVPKIQGSAQELGQVVLNLLINAAQASPAGSAITVQTRATPAGVELRVRDEGAGVPAAIRPRLFERHATTKAHGTGLGLFISRGIAEQHGGTLELEPTPKGATFLMRLPFAPSPPSAQATPIPVSVKP